MNRCSRGGRVGHGAVFVLGGGIRIRVGLYSYLGTLSRNRCSMWEATEKKIWQGGYGEAYEVLNQTGGHLQWTNWSTLTIHLDIEKT